MGFETTINGKIAEYFNHNKAVPMGFETCTSAKVC